MVTALDNDISDISDIKVDSVGDFTFPERNKFEVGFGIIAKDI